MLLEFSKPNRNNLLPAIKRISKKRKKKNSSNRPRTITINSDDPRARMEFKEGG